MAEFEIIRSKRKTMRLSVSRDGRAVVYAPLYVSDGEAEAFVRRHQRWLNERLREHAGVSLSDGASIPIGGRTLTIRSGARAAIKDGVLVLPETGREEALVGLLKRIARGRMQSLLLRISRESGFSFGALRITSARGRWGSCSSKRAISFTFRTAFLPDDLAEYLAVHELCHTEEMNHGARFWARVRGILPDYLARRRALKGYLWAMNVL